LFYKGEAGGKGQVFAFTRGDHAADKGDPYDKVLDIFACAAYAGFEYQPGENFDDRERSG
jgi:hypothetical protein